MQIQPKTPASTESSPILLESSAVLNPAEIHGILCGLICIEQELDGKFWFNTVLKLLEARDQVAMQRTLIIGLYDTAYRQLNSVTDECQLIIPKEGTTFTDRAVALSRWCKGFLYGLGLANKQPARHFSEEMQEALRCIDEIAKLDFDQIDVSESDQQAYQVVVEFVRTAVVTIYFEYTGQPLSSDRAEEMQSLH